jgi:hypothetical protein
MDFAAWLMESCAREQIVRAHSLRQGSGVAVVVQEASARSQWSGSIAELKLNTSMKHHPSTRRDVGNDASSYPSARNNSQIESGDVGQLVNTSRCEGGLTITRQCQDSTKQSEISRTICTCKDDSLQHRRTCAVGMVMVKMMHP